MTAARGGRSVGEGFPPAPVAPRRALLQRMDQAARRPAVYLRAPAGMGKSALLEQWIAARGKALMRIDVQDVSAAEGWQDVLARASVSSHDGIVLLLDPIPASLDDALAHRLARAIRDLPHGARLLMAGEQPCPAAWRSLQMEGRLSLMEADSLRLSPADIAEGPLSIDEQARLRYSGGWAAAYFCSELRSDGVALEPDAKTYLRERLFSALPADGAGAIPPFWMEHLAAHPSDCADAALRSLCALNAHYCMDAAAQKRWLELALEGETIDPMLALHIEPEAARGRALSEPCAEWTGIPYASALAHRSYRDFACEPGDVQIKNALTGQTFTASFGDAAKDFAQLVHAGLWMESGEYSRAYPLAIDAHAALQEHPALGLYSHALLAELHVAMHGSAAARAWIEALEAWAPRYAPYASAFITGNAAAVRLRLLGGDLDAADAWRETHPEDTVPDALIALYPGMVSLYAMEAAGQYHRMLPYGERLLRIARERRRPLDEIELCILLSQAYASADQPRRAAELFSAGMGIAAKGPWRHAFHQRRRSVSTLLNNLAAFPDVAQHPAFAAELRSWFLAATGDVASFLP